MSELAISNLVEGIPQIDTPISYSNDRLRDNLAFMNAKPKTVDEAAILLGTFDPYSPRTLGHVDPDSSTIVLFAGAIAEQSEAIVADRNSAWTRLAKRDQLATALNIVTAEKAARLTILSLGEEQRAKTSEKQRHNDEMLVATGLFLTLGATALYEGVGYVSHYGKYGQMAAGAAGALAAVASVVGLQRIKDNERESQVRIQDIRTNYEAREFSDSLTAAHLFGDVEVIRVESQKIAPIIELRRGITHNPTAAS